MKINSNDIEKILGFEINEKLKEQIEKFDLKYEHLTSDERDKYILSVVNVLLGDITYSGKHRIDEWEAGWNNNFELFKENKKIEHLIPKYHGKYNLVRWNGDIIKPSIDNFDYKIHICFIDAIIQHYIGNNENVFEFGCGPAYHLLRLNKFNSNLNLYGLDWAKSSQNIVNEINDNMNLNITPYNFDFFNPDYNLEVPEKSLFYTVAALEQVGENFKLFVDFILDKKPELCVHLEPIDELLDENNLIDKLSISYFRKRNHLNGFLPYLQKLEKENKIEIIKQQRIFSGSYFIEGHSLIVWKPKK